MGVADEWWIVAFFHHFVTIIYTAWEWLLSTTAAAVVWGSFLFPAHRPESFDISGHVNGLITAVSAGWALTAFLSNSRVEVTDEITKSYNVLGEAWRLPEGIGNDTQLNDAYYRGFREFSKIGEEITRISGFDGEISLFSVLFFVVMFIKAVDSFLATQGTCCICALY